MDNQHRKISGYRDLAPEEIGLVNVIKGKGDELGRAINSIEQIPDIDKRAVSIAKTHLQTGLMWLIRAITKPQGF